MLRNLISNASLAVLLALLLGACDGETNNDQTQASTTTPPASTEQTSLPLTVHKSATCSCCSLWVAHLESQGLVVNTKNTSDLLAVKSQHEISPQLASCHTAVSADGYVFEGHIPARYIHQFLASPPEGARGLAVPGMPLGSPGMEMGERFTPYQIWQINSGGSQTVFATIDQPAQTRPPNSTSRISSRD